MSDTNPIGNQESQYCSLVLQTDALQPKVVIDALNHSRLVTAHGPVEFVVSLPNLGLNQYDRGALIRLSRRFSRWITSARTVSEIGLLLLVIGGVGLVRAIAVNDTSQMGFNVSIALILSAIVVQVLERVLRRADQMETLILHAKQANPQ